ncbi:HAMP domain-containing methyl-accepting chemotaxis protein [Ensifer adhaerens]|uniref:HAMP domain-containing methyl-accepting chemotaxis protein n=1 Tax=Ensifer adhaerens TaxID=106592 RepID=UPI00098ED5BE|nr:methyl-accepting chemotaxis protein [Ensifer adhaerens]
MGKIRFGISARLGLGFGFLVALMMVLTWTSISEVNMINADLVRINDVNSVKQRFAINYRGSVHDRAIAIRDVVLVGSEAERQATVALIDKLAAAYAENEAKMADMVSAPEGATAEERSILAEIAGIQAKTNPLVAEIIALTESGDAGKAHSVLLEQARPLFVAWLGAVNKFIDYQENLNKTIGEKVRTSASGFEQMAMIELSFAVLLALVAAVLASRSITGPMARLRTTLAAMARGELDSQSVTDGRKDEIGDLARAVAEVRDVTRSQADERSRSDADRAAAEHARMAADADVRALQSKRTASAVNEIGLALEEMANGRLDYRITQSFDGELDRLRANFNASIGKLQETVEAIGRIAGSVDGGAREISSATNDLARRTEQQAASVEETAAALDEISTTVADSTKRAEEAGALVAETRRNAEKSGDVVAQAVAAMGEIERSSTEINSIISVIDDIAFQTNLLALNAGVEAARAGEAGKGFAVVAQEVRELAQRSATAAKEIKQLINSSGEQVRAGVSLVGQTGTALSGIVSGVQEINRHVVSIVEAAREQATALTEINSSVNAMDKSIQQNAAMVEETSAASQKLASDSVSLADLLAQFRDSTQRRLLLPTARPVPPHRRTLAVHGNTAPKASDWEEF